MITGFGGLMLVIFILLFFSGLLMAIGWVMKRIFEIVLIIFNIAIIFVLGVLSCLRFAFTMIGYGIENFWRK